MKAGGVNIRGQAGFTLLEMVVVVIILGIVSTIAMGLLDVQVNTYGRVFNRSVLMFEGRKAFSALRNELQGIAADSISVMQADELTFRNSDGNQIQYRYSNHGLFRNDEIIADFLQAAPFKYLDFETNIIGGKEDLAIIKVTLALSKGDDNLQLETFIYARN